MLVTGNINVDCRAPLHGQYTIIHGLSVHDNPWIVRTHPWIYPCDGNGYISI